MYTFSVTKPTLDNIIVISIITIMTESEHKTLESIWVIVMIGFLITWYLMFWSFKLTGDLINKDNDEPKACLQLEPLPTQTPTPTPLVFDGATTASWYSQDNLIQGRKAIANNSFGVAMHDVNFGDRFMVCLQVDPSRCVHVVHNDYCEGCETQFNNRAFDLQKEAFSELSNLSLGVVEVVYKKI